MAEPPRHTRGRDDGNRADDRRGDRARSSKDQCGGQAQCAAMSAMTELATSAAVRTEEILGDVGRYLIESLAG